MSVTRKVIEKNTSIKKSQKGDEIIVEYTSNLYDAKVKSKKNYRDKKYVYCTSR